LKTGSPQRARGVESLPLRCFFSTDYQRDQIRFPRVWGWPAELTETIEADRASGVIAWFVDLAFDLGEDFETQFGTAR
jgi:hypothetical protein